MYKSTRILEMRKSLYFALKIIGEMKQRYALFLLIPFVLACAEKKTPADLIIRGGKIYTANDNKQL